MKKFLLIMMGMVFLLGMGRMASAQVAPTMYTLEDIYYYLTEGTTATEGGHSLGPPSGATPGDTRFKTLSQIYQDTKTKFDQCDATTADVEEGKVFYSVEAGSWGVQTGSRALACGGMIVTGQTISYRTGDDGTYQTGTAYDYTDNSDGTLTDNATGLMWAKDGNGAGCRFGAQTDWHNNIAWAEGLTFATYSDWRLPNVEEMYSICVRDEMIGKPWINHTMFPNTYTSRYWTSTTRPNYTTSALIVDLNDGGCIRSRNKTAGSYQWVRAVRGGD